jgi:hypothetical protein
MKDLDANLYGVSYNVEAWEAALELYKFAKAPPEGVRRELTRQWVLLACAQCVMQLYHLRERLRTIKGFKVRPCASISHWIDDQQLRNATNLLDHYFPDIEDLRDAIAHTGTIGTNPSKHAPDGMFALVGFHEPGVFSAPYNGVMKHLAITDEALQRIRGVVSAFFQGFARAAQELERLGHAD